MIGASIQEECKEESARIGGGEERMLGFCVTEITFYTPYSLDHVIH
jgi:hypothetical protein